MTTLSFDYETWSEADLRAVGLSRYARHPSTEILMASYSFDNGPTSLWVPAEGEKMPLDFRDALLDSSVIKRAWNAQFERAVTEHVLGITIPIREWRCTMALAYSLSLPGALGECNNVLGVPSEKSKDREGKALIKTFCVPRKATKTKPWTRANKETDPEKWEKFKEYCIQDDVAQKANYNRLRKWEMSPTELEIWFLDQEINDLGIPINMKMVQNAQALLARVFSDRIQKLTDITGLDNPNSPSQLLKWLKANGYPFNDMKKGHIEAALKKELPEVTLNVLEMRAEISKSSVKKYKEFENATDDDGNLRYCFQYRGASRTGRWAGRRIQPQNLAKPVKYLEKFQESCAKALEIIDPEMLESLYAKPIDLLSTCVRPVIQAGAGHAFVDADLSAIENRVLGWLCDEQKILDVFREGRDPYLDFATYMFNEEYSVLLAEFEAGNKSKRTLGKAPTLGCFGPETLVLTDSGFKKIVEVSLSDKVFDGEEFVPHDGVVNMGKKAVINLSGVIVTPDHKILTKQGWRAASCVRGNTKSANDLAIGLSKILLRKGGNTIGSVAVRAEFQKMLALLPLQGGCRLAAKPVNTSNKEPQLSNFSEKRSITLSPIGSGTFRVGAITQNTNSLKTMGSGASVACLQKQMSSFSTSILSALINFMKSTELIIKGIMKLEICDPQIGLCKTVIDGIAQKSSMRGGYILRASLQGYSQHNIRLAEQFFENTKRALAPKKSSTIKYIAEARTTFDIVNAGPLHRFLIWSEDGPLIVHNCGYQLGVGEQFEDPYTAEITGTGLIGYALNMGISLSPEESELAVTTWRKTYSKVVDYWKDIETAAKRCIRSGKNTQAGNASFEMDGPFLKMILPSGSPIFYCRPAIKLVKTKFGMKENITYQGVNDKKQWGEIKTYGGKLVENAVQKIARDLLCHGMLLARKKGIRIRLHVHDQIVGRVKLDSATDKLKVLIECMTATPDWAPGLPLGAEGQITQHFMKD